MNEVMAVFPLSQAFLPGEWVALRVFEDRYLRMIDDIGSGALELCTVLIERGSEVGGDDVRLSHGVVLDIVRMTHDDMGVHLECRGGRLVSIVEWTAGRAYPTASTFDQEVEPLNASALGVVAGNLSRTISKCHDVFASMDVPADARDRALALCQTLQESLDRVDTAPAREESLWRTLWLVARMLPSGALDRYALLRPGSLTERATRLESIVDHVAEVLRFSGLR